MRWLDWTGCKYLSVVRRLCVMKAVVAAWRDDESCIISLRVLANKWSRVSRKWQYSAPPASCHDDRSWIIPTLDKWNMHTASVRRSNFWCPRNSWVNIIYTSHPGKKREIIFAGRRIIGDRWVMTGWPLACEGVISHIYIFRANIFLQGFGLQRPEASRAQ